jgi:hypothetical protein
MNVTFSMSESSKLREICQKMLQVDLTCWAQKNSQRKLAVKANGLLIFQK